MMPTVFRIPFLNKDIPGFGLMMMVGFLTAIWWAARRAQKSRANPDVVLNCGFIALIAGVVGARFMYVVAHWDTFASRGSPAAILWGIVDVSAGGLEYYGGLMLAAAGILFYLWRAGHSLRWYLDIMAPSAALGLAFGRIGCFMNGCCWGGVCNLPWAVSFPYASNAQISQWQELRPGTSVPKELIYVWSGGAATIAREDLAAGDEQIAKAQSRIAELSRQLVQKRAALAPGQNDPVQAQRLGGEIAALERRLAAAEARFPIIRAQMQRYGLTAAQLRELAASQRSLPVHPTQIYSSINALLIALLLNAWYWRRTRDGQVICLLFIIQPITRFVLEIIRTDVPATTLGFLTRSQFLAILLLAGGVIGWFLLYRLPARSPSVAQASRL